MYSIWRRIKDSQAYTGSLETISSDIQPTESLVYLGQRIRSWARINQEFCLSPKIYPAILRSSIIAEYLREPVSYHKVRTRSWYMSLQILTVFCFILFSGQDPKILGDYSWFCILELRCNALGKHLIYQGSNQGWLHARLVTYLLYNLFSR